MKPDSLIVEEKCRKCGAVLFKKGPQDDLGNTAVIRRTHRPPESDGKNRFYRCVACWAKNQTMIEISAEGVVREKITGVIE
jgi:hypothetical protein